MYKTKFMKKIILLFIALQIVVSVFAQDKLYVCKKDGSYTEFYVTDVDSIVIVEKEEDDDEPYIPKKLFSINPLEAVKFSPGNLQYHPGKKEWRFAPKQTDHVGKDNQNISPNYYGWIDLFGWGTGNNPTCSSTKYEDYSTFVDWGTNKIGDDEPNTWRSLSYNEWYYLLHDREDASDLIGAARVNGNNGIVLLPDDWVCPEGVDFEPGFGDTEYGYSTFQVITAPVWEKMEEYGAVFLPACGYRNGVTINELQETCRYWVGYWHTTETASMFYATAKEAYMAFTFPYDGLSVRLVSTAVY